MLLVQESTTPLLKKDDNIVGIPVIDPVVAGHDDDDCDLRGYGLSPKERRHRHHCLRWIFHSVARFVLISCPVQLPRRKLRPWRRLPEQQILARPCCCGDIFESGRFCAQELSHCDFSLGTESTGSGLIHVLLHNV